MSEYDVQIQATITKTERVEADTEDEAIEAAHSQFTSAVEEGVGAIVTSIV